MIKVRRIGHATFETPDLATGFAFLAQPAKPLLLLGAHLFAVVLFGLAYALERGVVEVWKTFVREEDQSKYFIAMQFSIRGVPVASRGARLTAGA